MAKAGKPKGWYGKAAKEARRAERERRRRVRETEAQMREVRQRKAAASRHDLDLQADRILTKAAASRQTRALADREYESQAKALRRSIAPKLSGVDRGTPHTQRHRQKTSFDRLCDARVVTGDMMQAAQEIERVYLAVCGAMLVRALDMNGGGRSAPRPMSDNVAIAHAKRYLPWARELARVRSLGGWPAVEIVFDIVIDGRPIRDVEKDKHLRNGAGKVALCWALLKYAAMAGWIEEGQLSGFEARHGVHNRLAEAA